MSSGSPTESVTTDAVFSFQPPAGGDLTLQSCDGVTFRVHSVLLGLASTVFAGMLTEATKPDTVELAEDAETISLMLAFIYPIDPPSITTIGQLEKVMLSSQKYDIEKMTRFIERCNRPDNQLILSNPIHAFRASIKHDFPALRMLSAKASGMKHIDPYSLKGIEELAGVFPESASVIGLIGAQLVRRKLLAEFLKGPRINASLMPMGTYSNSMACRPCWDKSRCNQVSGTGICCYTPGWMPLWLTRLHDRLMEKPMDPCEDLLSLLFIADLCGGNLEFGCLDCVKQTLTKRSLFEGWARDTKNAVGKELKVLDKLHSL